MEDSHCDALSSSLLSMLPHKTSKVRHSKIYRKTQHTPLRCRKHFRRKESPKKLTRGRCSHHHNISGSSSYLSNSCSSLATTVKTNNSSKVDTVQELGVMFIMSGTGNKMLESMEVVEGEERSYGVMGSVMTTVDETSYKVTLHQETLAGHQRQEALVSSLNMVVMVYRDMSELQDMVNNETGLLGHLRHYWRGFMPLLLVQVGCPGDMIKQTVTETLGNDFSSCFRLHISDPCSESNAIIENCVRFHLHNVKFQCSKLERSASSSQSLVSQQWKCSGLCGLESYKPDPLRKKKRSVINAIRRKISRMES